MELLIKMGDEIGLPRSFSSHMFTFVKREGSVFVLLGHPPRDLIEQVLKLSGAVSKLVIIQEEMHIAPSTYDLWPFQGEIKRYPINTPLDEALRLADALKSQPVPPAQDASPLLLPTVLAAGLADGINPCAFAVMAFFTALLFALRRTRQQILQMGTAYIVGMYVTYFVLGLGLLRTLDLLNQPHLFTQGGAVLVILFGLVQVKDAVFPGAPLHLTVPKPGWELIQSWARRANLPAALVLGGLVGLCTLPCSGGIYVAILGLLTSQANYATGIGYLSLYNLMFILPLAAILLVIGNRPMSLALANWERHHTRSLHGVIGVIMVGLGIFILGWLG